MINSRFLPVNPYNGQVTAVTSGLSRSKTYYAAYDAVTGRWIRLR